MLEWVIKYWVQVLFGLMSTGIIAFIKVQINTNKAIRLGLQAILRDRLRDSYLKHSENGYVGVDDRENWVNMYNQYHNLGANGVMDDIKKKFLELPTTKQN